MIQRATTILLVICWLLDLRNLKRWSCWEAWRYVVCHSRYDLGRSFSFSVDSTWSLVVGTISSKPPVSFSFCLSSLEGWKKVSYDDSHENIEADHAEPFLRGLERLLALRNDIGALLESFAVCEHISLADCLLEADHEAVELGECTHAEIIWWHIVRWNK